MSVKNKILFVSHDASRTGAPMFLLNLIRWIRANTELGVSIILRAGGALEEQFRALGETHVLNDACGSPKFVQDISLIYSNTCTNGAFLETLPYGTIPIITHSHEMQAIIESYGPANWQIVQKQTSHFIACSDAVQAGLARLGIGAEKISTIHSSIPVKEVLAKGREKNLAQIKSWHSWEKYEHIVAACGVAEWRKGADLFVQVAHAVKQKLAGKNNILFLWVGILPPDERGTLLNNDVRQLALEDTVQFLGEQINPHLYLNACDVFCLTSREDPFPLVMLEAAALGKPLLCFEQSGGGEEFCKRGGGVAVPFLDIDAMATAVLDLTNDAVKRKSMGAAAAKIVAENFDFAATAPQVLCEIERLARKPSQPAFGNAQIYFPSANGYAEQNSKVTRIAAGRWTRVQFELPAEALLAPDPIRIDPIDRSAAIEITGVAIKSVATGKTVWRMRSTSESSPVQPGNGVSVPDDRVLRIVSHDSDPYIFVKVPAELLTGEALKIEWWQCVSEDVKQLTAACHTLKEQITELERVKGELERIKLEQRKQLDLIELERQKQELAKAARWKNRVKNSKALRSIRKFLKK